MACYGSYFVVRGETGLSFYLSGDNGIFGWNGTYFSAGDRTELFIFPILFIQVDRTDIFAIRQIERKRFWTERNSLFFLSRSRERMLFLLRRSIERIFVLSKSVSGASRSTEKIVYRKMYFLRQ